MKLFLSPQQILSSIISLRKLGVKQMSPMHYLHEFIYTRVFHFPTYGISVQNAGRFVTLFLRISILNSPYLLYRR